MSKLGVIDIGSNSIRLVVLETNNERCFKVIYEKKVSVRLGMDMTPEGELNPARINKAMEVLKFFMDIIRGIGADKVLAVATEAVRRATKQEEFTNRAKNELGLNIRVLSGKEEAFYDYFGTINSMAFDRALIMDIGGCSNQLILVEDKKIVNSISLPYGAINLSERYKLKGIVNDQDEDELRDFLFTEYDKIPWLKDAKGYTLIGVGGTIRNIGKISRKKSNYKMHLSHNYEINTEEVYDIYNLVKNKDIKQREKIKGLSKDRSDIFLGAVAAVLTVLEYCRIPKVLTSSSGLREGLIYEYILEGKNPVEDALDYSLNNILDNLKLDRKHSERVWKYTEILYSQLKNIHNIREDMWRTLKTASLLHDCGATIDYYDHHKHSFYMILNTRINGLSHKEQLMAAYITAFHRKGELKIDTNQYKDILNKDDIMNIRKLGILLKISESLDQRQNGNIEKIQCNVQEDMVIIKLFSKDNPEIEINDVRSISETFRKLFNKALYVR